MKQEKKRVVLRKVTDTRFVARYNLEVFDPASPSEYKVLLLATYATTIGERGRFVLSLKGPSFPEGTDFDAAVNVPEANRFLYERLKEEAPQQVREVNSRGDNFPGWYDETGMGRKYNPVGRLKKRG
jgi:hypothetical protein